MSENIKEALEYAVELNQQGLEIVMADDGTEYYDANKVRMVELDPKRYPETLHLKTLKSLVDYLKSGLNGLDEMNLIVVVEDNKEVTVYTEDDELENRVRLISVAAQIPIIPFDSWQSSEQFNIMLQSLFINSDDRSPLLDFASRLKVENGAEIQDSGVNQVTTVKNGVASLAQAKTPNPVTLRPYRTFAEVDQPESQFVFRINSQANLALFEADGGKWRLEAIENVANYLREELSTKENITILA